MILSEYKTVEIFRQQFKDMTLEIKNSLKELGFNHNETAVYIALTQLGEARASAVAKKADLPRTTAISILNKLKEENYITTHLYRGVIYYWIESPKVMTDVLEYKMEIARKLNGLLSDLYRDEAHFPSALVLDTKSGIKKYIEKILAGLRQGSTIYTIDTPEVGNYAKIFSDTTGENIMALKQKRKIITNTLVPFGSFKNIAAKKIETQNITVKEMPQNIKFDASLWIIKDTIAHFSGNPPFLVIIKHDKIVAGIKSLYNFLWNISEAKKK